MTYTFVCSDCSRVFSKDMTIAVYTEASIHACPHCKSINTRRLILTVPVAIFADSGFTKHVEEEE